MSQNARSFVFDAGIIALYYAGNSAVKLYFSRVFAARARGFVSEVNLAEFYYKAAEKRGIETADVWYVQVRRSRMKVTPPDESITRRAALWKTRVRNLSLADCFALATREERAEILLTTDSGIKEAGGPVVVLIRPQGR